MTVGISITCGVRIEITLINQSILFYNLIPFGDILKCRSKCGGVQVFQHDHLQGYCREEKGTHCGLWHTLRIPVARFAEMFIYMPGRATGNEDHWH
jgi:hypothetical protein